MFPPLTTKAHLYYGIHLGSEKLIHVLVDHLHLV